MHDIVLVTEVTARVIAPIVLVVACAIAVYLMWDNLH